MFQPARRRYSDEPIGLALCFVNRHLPNRRAAKWDGTGYVSSCRHCGKAVRRKRRNNWQLDTGAD